MPVETVIQDRYDVVIVGGGPVGQLLAILLGGEGRRIGVFERWPSRYPDPRACGLGHEPLRVLQAAGVMEALKPHLDFVIGEDRAYQFRNAEQQVLLEIAWSRPGTSGWPEMSTFYQPDLEDVLEARLGSLPDVELHRGWEVVGVEQDADQARAMLRRHGASGPAERTVRADWIIGADGARSVVRGVMDTKVEDLGFDFDWLVVDTIPHEPRVWSPYLEQRCDPARPTTCVPSGPGRRRWEFMRLPGETMAELNTEAAAWRLLEPWGLRPDNATLVRHAVYTFNGRWADRWRNGRLLLAGDSAHLMPPFLGQGLGSGLRDALALAWRLRLVMDAKAPESLLDSYGPERVGHVRQIVEEAVGLGRVICILDPQAAAERDRTMIGWRSDPALAPPPPPPWRLGAPGLLVEEDPSAGLLGVQGRVRRGEAEGLFDDVIGSGFSLISPAGDPGAALSPEARAMWSALGGITAHVSPEGPVRDLEGAYGRWFAEHGVGLALFRPDFYVFGTGQSPQDAERLVRRLAQALGLPLAAAVNLH